MRVMLALRGAPGSGKSTFIKENHAEEFKISMDDIRVALYGLRRQKDNTLTIPQDFNKKVFEIFMSTLEDRMKREEFIIVDNTNTRISDLEALRKLCKQYRYRFFVKDFTDYSDKKKALETLKERNESRSQEDKVPEWALIKMLARLYESQKGLKRYTLISELSELSYRKVDLNAYSRVLLCGDIHGNAKALDKVLSLLKKDDVLILLGDVVDRGIENDKVIEKLYVLAKENRVVMIRGNHELWLMAHARGDMDAIRSPLYREVTLPQIESIPDFKEKISFLSEKLLQAFYFTFAGEDYFVSHAALPYWNPLGINYTLDELCRGREDTSLCEKLYTLQSEKGEKPSPYQVHGHISSRGDSIFNGRSINLNSRLEFGGDMPLLILGQKGEKTLKVFKDSDFIYTPQEINQRIITIMRTSRNIEVKPLPHNLESFNFTKETFKRRVWDDFSSKARGLFYSSLEKDVVARGYEKFFNFGELVDDDISPVLSDKEDSWNTPALEYYKEKMVFPLTYSKKENGFLGLISLLGNKLLFCSKSNAIREDDIFSDEDPLMRFPRMLRDIVKSPEKIKKALQELNQNGLSHTLVFEVLDPIRDPHIVKYAKPHVVLLDIFENSLKVPVKLPFDKIKEVATSIEEETKTFAGTVESFDELEALIKTLQKEKDFEGYVFEDQNGFMFKLKTDWYMERKRLRSFLYSYRFAMREAERKGEPINPADSFEKGDFKSFLKTLSPKGCEKDFISLYDEFLALSADEK